MGKRQRIVLDRRAFLQFSGASLAACGATFALSWPAYAEIADPESEGRDAISLEDLLQYARTGAIPFWVASEFVGTWLNNLRFNALPSDLNRYYRNAGSTYRSLVGAESIWETIPRSVRVGGPDALREFHASRDWSHFVPRSLGGSDSANAGIFEKKLLNQVRGAAPMTAAEIAQARYALNATAVRNAVTLAAKATVTGALVAVAIEGTFAVMEYGLLYQEGKISQPEFLLQVGQHLIQSGGVSVAIAGLVVGLTLVFPPLLLILSSMTLPLAFVVFALVGHRFYELSAEWMQSVGLAPLQAAWDKAKAVPLQVWAEASHTLAGFRQQLGDISTWALREAKDVAEGAWQGTGDVSGVLWQGAGNLSMRTWQQVEGLPDGTLVGIGEFSAGAWQGAGSASQRAVQVTSETSMGAWEWVSVTSDGIAVDVTGVPEQILDWIRDAALPWLRDRASPAVFWK